MVADEMNTASFARVSATPLLPNRMDSVCAALTTTLTTMSAAFAASAGVFAPSPPSATNRATTSSDTSQPVTSKPARRSEVAMPKPIEPSPMTAACGLADADGVMRLSRGFLTAGIGGAAWPLGTTAWPRCQSMRKAAKPRCRPRDCQGRDRGCQDDRNQNPRGNLPARPLAVRARPDAGLVGQYQRQTGRRRLAGDADQCLARLARPGADGAARRRRPPPLR